jgi:DNA-binding transcriptional ArsR family regulator
MPLPTSDLLYPGDEKTVTVSLSPAYNIQHLLYLLTQAGDVSGFDEWIYRTAAAMTPEERLANDVVMVGLYYSVVPDDDYPSFPAFIDSLAAESPIALRNRILDVYLRKFKDAENGRVMSYDELLADVNTFLSALTTSLSGHEIIPEIERRAYTYLIDPPSMQQLIVSHMRNMWYKYLAVEWERVRPMLQQSVQAFSTADLSAMDRQAAAEYVIGRSIEGEHWFSMLDKIERIAFVPSAHVGPYVAKVKREDTIYLIFGARQPENAGEPVADLSRAELLVRLGALADDTRLSILKLVADDGELRSQDIMQQLVLSQSATSRHLQQLAAAGFLNERRCNGAKCYALNGDRISATLQALGSFLTPAMSVAAVGPHS